MKTKDKV